MTVMEDFEAWISLENHERMPFRALVPQKDFGENLPGM